MLFFLSVNVKVTLFWRRVPGSLSLLIYLFFFRFSINLFFTSINFIVFFFLSKLLLDNFTHHNIDMACNLLETCGRFLYRSPESHTRMAELLVSRSIGFSLVFAYFLNMFDMFLNIWWDVNCLRQEALQIFIAVFVVFSCQRGLIPL